MAEDARVTLGLSPGAPQITSLPGGVTPAFGEGSQFTEDWRFDFHGLVLAPLRIGIGERENPLSDQKKVTLHGPPLVPGDFESFEHTGVLQSPWVQLNFTYGNPNVTATVIVAARTINQADSYFNPPDHIGINDAFLTYRFPIDDGAAVTLHAGAFANTYGAMGEYDLGKYGTPLIARVGGMGATARGDFEMGSMILSTEVGFTGQTNKAPLGIEPAGWNGFADPNVGTSFAVHGHALAYLQRKVGLGVHAIRAFVQDDRATPLPENKDGSISVLGADLRLTLDQYGHLYLGYAHTSANTARAVSGVIRVLNAPGGPGLMEEYFGPDSGGTGSLDTFGAQYDLSLGHYLRMREGTVGDGPDVVLSPFAMLTQVGSEDTETVDEDGRAVYDDITKVKYGGEVTYSFLSWLAASFRYDRVIPDTEDSDETFAILSPRVIFRSDWKSQDQVMLQYSRWLNGSRSGVYGGYPAVKDLSVRPDEHSVVLSASMWW